MASMKLSLGLLLAAAVMLACGSDGASTPEPVAQSASIPSSASPAVAVTTRRLAACQEKVDQQGHVAMDEITPAMLQGTGTEPGSWHLEASRLITFWWCHQRRGRSSG